MEKLQKYELEFTFYADWHPEEFEEITASVVRYKGVQPETEVIPIMNNTNYRYLMPSMDPCDGNGELRELISKPQNCSVSWAFAITNSIEYAIKKMYFEEYDQIVEVSLSAQELIDCVGENGDDFDGVYDEKKGGCAGFSLASGFDYVSMHGIAYSESYPHRNEKGDCRRKEIGDEHRYRIAGYEKPVTYNKLGLFDLMKRGPVAVTMGLDPQYFQYYRSDRDGEFYFDSSSNQPSVYGVVVEYSQFAVDGKDELAKYPYFAVETRLRACNSMVFRLPILDTVENANVGGIAGLAIRPIVSNLVEVKPTVVPTVIPSLLPTEQPTTQPTNPPTQSPTIHPTTVLPTTQPTGQPTTSPTTQPTNPPTLPTTVLPTTQPTNPPTQSPTIQPTNPPTSQPTEQPTTLPTTQPTQSPTIQPTIPPTTVLPTTQPTDQPTTSPPTIQPTNQPTTSFPTIQPTNPLTTETPTTIVPTTCPPVEIAVVPSELAPNPETIEEIRINTGLCSSYQGTEFILRGLPALKSIMIGDYCFVNVRVFELDGLCELESVVIGQQSFRIGSFERNDGSYRIVNSPKLKSIQIGYESFEDYHTFELNNLPSLQTIDISGWCFRYAPSFSLTGLIDGLV